MFRKFQYEIFADYHQFYLQDDDPSFGDLSEAWTEAATDRLLAVAARVIGVGTVRNVSVPVSVTIHDSRPTINDDEWDHIVAASFQVESGRIVIAGCTDYFPDAARIDVEPGTYEAIVCYSNLSSVSGDSLNGADAYHIHLFRGKEIQPVTIKNWKSHP